MTGVCVSKGLSEIRWELEEGLLLVAPGSTTLFSLQSQLTGSEQVCNGSVKMLKLA